MSKHGADDDGTLTAGAPEAAQCFLAATVDKVRNAKIELAATWTDEYLGKR